MPKRRQTHRVQPNAEHRRRRVYAACGECRRRRRKCDGSQPCAQCDAYGYACAYNDDSAPSAQSPASESRPPETAAPPPPCSSSRAAGPPSTGAAVIVSRERGRIVHAHSAVALPRLVGQALALEPPPRLHSYAWNLGLRAERRGTVPGPSLPGLLTLPECRSLCAVYFAAVHPLFPLFRREAFLKRIADGWATMDAARPNLAAVVALVAALGSSFSSAAHPHEREVALRGVALLDLGLSSPAAAVDADAVAGWVLRALYMRLTTRPAISCVASHTAMHLAEIVGMHRDPVADGALGGDEEELETRRRCFSIAGFLNRLLATEYGVSGVSMRHANCAAPAPAPGTHVEALHAMSCVLADADTAAAAGLDSDDFAELFPRLRDTPHSAEDDTVALFAADVCLCLLRRFAAAASGSTPGPRIVRVAAEVLRRALDAIAGLLAAGRTWWNMLSVPFQSVCVCVASDDAGMLELLPAAMEMLRGMADRFGSHMAREALATAQQVIAASRGRTEGKLALKDAALAHALPLPADDIDWTSFDLGFDVGGEWPSVVDFFM
ncbi:transcriptional repressor involved in the control of multidrug resistance [Cordyceps fumosorosea ARSEF 2679]|uniref:Transcriptional repressor involved in the control of multidrug resistance n=1 Tax=Cordyceps fumosorosea (strain ARSEF 2679) TaxID=1081104 RepID=A0A167SW41_CORFA|nr:transcriptional repressor involved in the control of multidrug resistance [Cordyceps fumosorosea ARSEF 2679]OAA59987.1 transcriptional repressor involved in the control of multidrug resistance [Cordyceps fumosorosea ARSEF 2679]